MVYCHFGTVHCPLRCKKIGIARLHQQTKQPDQGRWTTEGRPKGCPSAASLSVRDSPLAKVSPGDHRDFQPHGAPTPEHSAPATATATATVTMAGPHQARGMLSPAPAPVCFRPVLGKKEPGLPVSEARLAMQHGGAATCVATRILASLGECLLPHLDSRIERPLSVLQVWRTALSNTATLTAWHGVPR